MDLGCRLLENLLIFSAGLMVIAAMIITFADVIMRYFFNAPLNWSFDFITMYLLPGSYFLAFSYALRTGNHLKVDYFKDFFPSGFSKFCVSIFSLIAAIIFSYITYTYSLRAYEAWQENEVIYSAINWLVWPKDFIIAISAFVFSYRLLIKMIDNYAFDNGGEL